jgi:GNAT superfamily N-acetyltransferase
MGITYHEDEVPSPGEVRALYRAVDWRMKPLASDEVLQQVWERADHRVTVRDDEGGLIAMARAIGDGGFFIGIYDVVVDPAWQGHGIGTEMMRRLMAFIETGPWYRTFLFSAPGKEGFYAKLGFLTPEEVGMTPMFRWKPEYAALHASLHQKDNEECCPCPQ